MSKVLCKWSALPSEEKGVIAFAHGAPIIESWAEMCIKASADLRGDQEALSRLCFDRGFQISTFPAIFNWRAHLLPEKPGLDFIFIIHWLGFTKTFIPKQIEIFEGFGMNFAL